MWGPFPSILTLHILLVKLKRIHEKLTYKYKNNIPPQPLQGNKAIPHASPPPSQKTKNKKQNKTKIIKKKTKTNKTKKKQKK